jgi:hypothetical protein
VLGWAFPLLVMFAVGCFSSPRGVVSVIDTAEAGSAGIGMDAKYTGAEEPTSVGVATRDTGAEVPSVDRRVTAISTDCNAGTPLPPLPVTTTTAANLWFVLPGTKSAAHARSRGQFLYVAANPPLRLDWQQLTICSFADAYDPGTNVYDVLAPTASHVLLFTFSDQFHGGPRKVRVSLDDGRSWINAREPGMPAAGSAGFPSALAVARISPSSLRLFATYGGSTLDFSDTDGLDWSRAVEGGDSPAPLGFAVDSAGENLWMVSSLVLDRVTAFWMPLSGDGSVPSQWSGELLQSWGGSNCYAAEADPFDPHAMYLGGDGRIGYLHGPGRPLNVDLPWMLMDAADQSYVLVMALWPDPQVAGHVVFGGEAQDSSYDFVAQLRESLQGGQAPSTIPIEGAPNGGVAAMQRFPAAPRLLVLVNQKSDQSIAGYVIDR